MACAARLNWKRGNTLGAGLSGVGLVAYLFASLVPDSPIGMDPIMAGLAAGLAGYLVGVAFGAPPTRGQLVKFWGTNAAVQQALESERTARSMTA